MAQQPRKGLIQPLAVPRARHVGLAEAEGAAPQRLAVDPRVVDPDVPGPAAVDAHTSGREQPLGCAGSFKSERLWDIARACSDAFGSLTRCHGPGLPNRHVPASQCLLLSP